MMIESETKKRALDTSDSQNLADAPPQKRNRRKRASHTGGKSQWSEKFHISIGNHNDIGQQYQDYDVNSQQPEYQLTDDVYFETKKQIDIVAYWFTQYYKHVQKIIPEGQVENKSHSTNGNYNKSKSYQQWSSSQKSNTTNTTVALQQHSESGSDAEWQKFWKCMHQPLCVSFRLCGVSYRKHEVESALKEEIEIGSDFGTTVTKKKVLHLLTKGPTTIQETGRKCPEPRKFRLANANNESATVAFQLSFDQRTLSRHFPSLNRWIIKHSNKTGLLQRQEIVSMFPVLLLQIQNHHRVLDLCASPGSKTSQALERILDQTENQSQTQQRGYVIANELDKTRASTLAYRMQLKGYGGNDLNKQNNLNKNIKSESEVSQSHSIFPAAHSVVTNHRAQIFPQIFPNHSGYDRIIADVPCSGCGTMRKYEDKWKTWSPFLGLQLHSLQLQILLRSMRLLKVGGVICYSTCSLNPVENEAVVLSGMMIGNSSSNDHDQEDVFEIIDIHNDNEYSKTSSLLPCKVAKGLRTWKVVARPKDVEISSDSTGSSGPPPSLGLKLEKDSEVYNQYINDNDYKDSDSAFVVLPDNYNDSKQFLLNKSNKNSKSSLSRYRKTMWPNFRSDGDFESLHKRMSKSLSNSIRFVPHYSNTGGFYCCLIRKKKEWPAAEKIKSESSDSVNKVSKTRRKLKTVFSTDREPGGGPGLNCDKTNIGQDESCHDESDTKRESESSDAPIAINQKYIKCRKTVNNLNCSESQSDNANYGSSEFLLAPSLHDVLSKPSPLNIIFAGQKVKKKK